MDETLKKTYKLLFVQDKRFKKGTADFRNLSKDVCFATWAHTMVDEGRWKDLEDNPGAEGFIMETRSNQMPQMINKVNVVVDEWVCDSSMSWLLY